MTTLVTGATGHIGNNLVRALLARGERVRVLCRPSSSPKPLLGLDVERFEGDLRDAPSLARAVAGVERVYHVAAMISIRSGDREALWDANVAGTARLLAAARQAGVKRVVHTSSFGAMGNNPNGPSSEQHALDANEPATDYERSKAASEVEVKREIERGLDACIVNPCATVGPFDFRPSLVGRTFVDFATGKMKAYLPGAFDWVPMRDVVSGHLLAMDKGGRGERYLLSGEVASLDQILDWLAEDTGRPRPRFCIPAGLMLAISLPKDLIEARFFPDKYPRFNQHSIRLLTSGKYGSNLKACRELGLSPTPIREAFRASVAWFRDNGYF
ncbi:MAG TPA: SDR family oxidoreductase [Polyangiaceae bacterium]|jgi:nucleoside-diphosphate-sugar epimerase|nr:SDR family oxidoreductase [Polyangiaceae bacterium]